MAAPTDSHVAANASDQSVIESGIRSAIDTTGYKRDYASVGRKALCAFRQ
jgi:hypothetical protein